MHTGKQTGNCIQKLNSDGADVELSCTYLPTYQRCSVGPVHTGTMYICEVVGQEEPGATREAEFNLSNSLHTYMGKDLTYDGLLWTPVWLYLVGVGCTLYAT